VPDDLSGEPAHPGEDAAEAGRDARPATPFWVKAFAAIALGVVLVFVVLLVLGGGHSPGRHAASGDPDHTPFTHLPGAQPQP
jgi:hypothetical protein